MQKNYKATCVFLNVGQGTSQVIHIGKQRAIIIDTGPKYKQGLSPLISWLQDRNIQSIESLILSHNDEDHRGEAERILTNYAQRIKKLYLLADRDVKKDRFYGIVENAIKKKHIEKKQIYRLETDNEPKLLFEDDDIKVVLLFPAFLDNHGSQKPNDTCAIIAFIVGTQKIIFSGDAPIAAWRTIVEQNGRIAAQIFTAPHHGGNFTNSKQDTDAFQKEIDWFHQEAIESGCAIVSVGTNNTYGHPEPKIIKSYTERRIQVFCTQKTSKCCDGSSTKDTVCCGTIEVNVGSNNVCVKDFDSLQSQKSQFTQRLCQ